MLWFYWQNSPHGIYSEGTDAPKVPELLFPLFYLIQKLLFLLEQLILLLPEPVQLFLILSQAFQQPLHSVCGDQVREGHHLLQVIHTGRPGYLYWLLVAVTCQISGAQTSQARG